MSVVDLVFQLGPGELDVARIDDNNKISGVLVGGKTRLVFSSQDFRQFPLPFAQESSLVHR